MPYHWRRTCADSLCGNGDGVADVLLSFDYAHTDHGYARIDGGPEAPGYLTYKQNSGIENLLTNEDKEKSIYSLDGQHLSTPQKGVNIIGGKKVVVR